jgi:chorismate mutase
VVIAVGVGVSGCSSVESPASQPSVLEGLVHAAAERLAHAEGAAGAKWGTDIRVDDPSREQEVLDAVDELARRKGLSVEYVHRIFRDQIDATEAIQYVRYSEWELDPSAAPAEKPVLGAVRADIDRLNHLMIDEIAAHQELLGSLQCGPARGAAVSSVAAQLDLDELYRRALERATQSYCDQSTGTPIGEDGDTNVG